MDPPIRFLLVPSLLTKLDQGHLAAALSKYGEVYHATGPAQQTLAELRRQGVIPASGSGGDTVELIIVASPPASWDVNDDDNPAPVGRGLHETINLFANNCAEVELTRVIFASAQDIPKGGRPTVDNVYVREAEYHDGDLVTGGAWNNNYATYDLEYGQFTLQDWLQDEANLEEADKSFRRAPTPTSTGVPEEDGVTCATIYHNSSGRTLHSAAVCGSLLAAGVRMGIVKMRG